MLERASPLILPRRYAGRLAPLLWLCALLCALVIWPARPAQATVKAAEDGFDPALVAALGQVLDQAVAGKTPGAA
jgi:hypothetical protein